MEIPEWLTEARVALIISLMSATFTGLGLLYTRRLAKNDTARMKRKPLVFEVSNNGPSKEVTGFDSFSITVRNLEPVAAKITGVRVAGRKQQLLTRETAFDPGPNPWDASVPKDCFPVLRSCQLTARIGPVGTPQHEHNLHPAATVYLSLYAKGVHKTSDVQVDWHWADGKKD